jgi:TRAP-type C4-dicarboxylate transport system permease small subunit
VSEGFTDNDQDRSGDRLSHWLRRSLGVLAALVLFAMMTLTFVDVIGRYWFDSPVPGGFEVTEMMMATLIFAGLPLVTARQEHVTIDLFDAFIPVFMRRPRDGIINLLCAVMMGAVTWRMWIKAGENVDYGDVTAILHIPMWPMTYFMVLMATATTIVFAILTVVGFIRRNGRPA